MKLLSIIVPVYNTEKYLPRCLDSLVNQDLTEEQYEIIVINDGSEDNSKAIVEDYMIRFPQIRYFEQSNQGAFHTRNIGVGLARGKYLYFIDSDDYIATDVLGKLLSFIQRKNLDVFGFGIIQTTDSTIPLPHIDTDTLEDVTISDGPSFISENKFREESVWLILRSDFLKSKNLSYGSDVSFSDCLYTIEVLYNADRIAVIPDIIYAYFQRPDSIMNNTNPEHRRYMVKRYEETIKDFRQLRERIENEKKLSANGLIRIRSKETSLVVYMLVRAMKSDMSLKEINSKIRGLKAIDYYPIRGFRGIDQDTLLAGTMEFVINNRLLFFASILSYRTLMRLRLV